MVDILNDYRRNNGIFLSHLFTDLNVIFCLLIFNIPPSSLKTLLNSFLLGKTCNKICETYVFFWYFWVIAVRKKLRHAQRSLQWELRNVKTVPFTAAGVCTLVLTGVMKLGLCLDVFFNCSSHFPKTTFQVPMEKQPIPWTLHLMSGIGRDH